MLFNIVKKGSGVHHHCDSQTGSHVERIKPAKDMVAVLGEGYSGFPLACVLAGSSKYNVYGIDSSALTLYRVTARFIPGNESEESSVIRHLALQKVNDFSILKHMKYVILSTPRLPYSQVNVGSLLRLSEITKHYLQKDQIVMVEASTPQRVIEELIAPILEQSGLLYGEDFQIISSFSNLSQECSQWTSTRVREIL